MVLSTREPERRWIAKLITPQFNLMDLTDDSDNYRMENLFLTLY